MVLWALAEYRHWSYRLASPLLLPTARALFATLSAYRGRDLLPVSASQPTVGEVIARRRTPTQDEGHAREKILEAALDALSRARIRRGDDARDRGAGGVATGLAYYYFDSKDAIVLAFYQRAQDDLRGAARRRRMSTARSAARLEAMIVAKFAYFKPNRRFLGALMAHAADPASPLSPFGEASREIRELRHRAVRARARPRRARPCRAIWRRTWRRSSGSIRWDCCSSGSTTRRPGRSVRATCSRPA